MDITEHMDDGPPLSQNSLCLPEQLLLIERLRSCATFQQKTVDNLRTQLAELKEECRKQHESSVEEKKILEEEKESLIEAYRNEMVVLRVKYEQDKNEAFQSGYSAANFQKCDYENELSSLKSALSEALAYRQKCLSLQKEISQLREEISGQYLYGQGNSCGANLHSEHAAQPCLQVIGVESGDQIQDLKDQIRVLQSELSAEKSAREKEREVLKNKIAYETGRHVYYRQLYCELQETGAQELSTGVKLQSNPDCPFSCGAAREQEHSQPIPIDYCRTLGAIVQELSTSDDWEPSQHLAHEAATLDRRTDEQDADVNPDSKEERKDEAEDLTQPETVSNSRDHSLPHAAIIHASAHCTDMSQKTDQHQGLESQCKHTSFLPEKDCDVSREGCVGNASPGTCPTPQSRRLSRRPSKKQVQQEGRLRPLAECCSIGLPQKRPLDCEETTLPRRAQRTGLQHSSPAQRAAPIDVHKGLVSHQCDVSPSTLDSAGSQGYTARAPVELDVLPLSRECLGHLRDNGNTVDPPRFSGSGGAGSLQESGSNSGAAHDVQRHCNQSQLGGAATNQNTTSPVCIPSNENIAPLDGGTLAFASPVLKATVPMQELPVLTKLGCQNSACTDGTDQAFLAQSGDIRQHQKLQDEMRIDMKKFSSRMMDASHTSAFVRNSGSAPQQVSNSLSMPPPAKRGDVPGWRQRIIPFEEFDQALGLLGVSKALSSPEPAPALVRPAIVDQRPTSATPNTHGGYKYVEVIRKQGDRSALLGVECIHCQRFYDALESWGTFDALPGCGHISQGLHGLEKDQVNPSQESSRGFSGLADKGKVLQAERLSRQELCQEASRHRYRNPPCATPQGFWDMGFRDSLDSRFS